jgi:hypothetical protein
MEKFLHSDVDKCALSIFVKIRISNSNLNIERGRYIKLPVEKRICEGTTELILENNSLRRSSNLGHFKMKCISSSGSILQRGHILFSTGSLMYLPLSIFRLLLLILILICKIQMYVF